MFAWLPLQFCQGLEHKVWITFPPFSLIYLTSFVAEWQEDIRTAIQGIRECLGDVYWIVRDIAIKELIRLAAQGMDCVSTFPFDVLNIVCSRMARGYSNGTSWHCGMSE